MSKKYSLAQEALDRKDIDMLIDWLKGYPRLTMGEVNTEYEQRWSSWLGRKYSVSCNSGSSANLLMYYVLLRSDRLRNKKVVVPSTGWPTTITPAIQFGFEPIMCEADRETFGLDLNHLEALLKKHSPAIVTFVQVLGVPHKMDGLMALKEKYGFFLLEDACASMGSRHKGRKVGTYGDMASFSTYYGHQCPTIEGGLVSTDDKRLYNLLLMLRSHGWSKDLDRPSAQELISEYGVDDFHNPFIFYDSGFNVRSSDLQASIGINQIGKLDWIAQRRDENHNLYSELLSEYFYTQKYSPNSTICSIHFAILAASSQQRKRIITALVENNISTRVFTAGNLGLHPFWYKRYGKFLGPVATAIFNRGLFLPNGPSISTEDVRFISEVVIKNISEEEREKGAVL